MQNRTLKAFPILTTERLSLRQLSQSDVHEIFLLRSDPLINKYLDRQPARTPDQALEFIKKVTDNNLTYWAIAEKGNEKLVGTVCLFDVSEEVKNCEIGYELLTQHQGMGLMREAVKKVSEYAIESLRIKTIYASTHKDNLHSTKLLKNLGFITTENADTKDSNLIRFQLDL